MKQKGTLDNFSEPGDSIIHPYDVPLDDTDGWFTSEPDRDSGALEQERLDYPSFENFPDFERLPTSRQLEAILPILDAADADVAYAFFEGFKMFNNIVNSDFCSPLVKTLARGGLRLDPNDNYYWGDRSNNNDIENIKTSIGYDSIVLPSHMLGSVMRNSDATLTEEELKSKLRSLWDDFSEDMANTVSEDEESENSWREHLNRQYELEDALKTLYYNNNQARLHNEFLSLPRDMELVRIAQDAAAAVGFKKKYDIDGTRRSEVSFFDCIETSDGQVLDLKGFDAEIDNEPLLYVAMVHNNELAKDLIGKTIGIRLVDIPLASQMQLLKFMAEADDGRFDKLCSTLQGVDEKTRLKLAEGFLAADFGPDFGDALLDIANSSRISSEQLGEILDTVGSCRESIREISGLYDEFDSGDFAKQYSRAANERLTDAITVFKEIAAKGGAKANLGWPGEVELDYNKAMEALNYEAKSLGIISGTLGDVASGKTGAFAELVILPKERRQSSLYNLYSPEHGYVLLYTRPEGSGSFDSTFEYGKSRSRYDKTSDNVGVEASISLMTNPVDPFSLPNPFRPNAKAAKNPRFYDSGTMDKVSALRLDREGRAPGASADDPNRDPVNPAGMVSVDLAAIGDRADTPSGKIARLLSVGGVLRAGNGDSALNHNTHWFDQAKYGTDKGFERLVDYIDAIAKEWCVSHPSGKNEGFRGVTRKTNRSRGRKAGRAVAA